MSTAEKRAQILYLEDDPDWKEKIREYLGSKYDVTIVDSPGGAEKLLFPRRSADGQLQERPHYDLFIADISLVLGDSGDEQGLKFVEEIRNYERIYGEGRKEGEESMPSLKIMILTAYPWRDRIKRAFRDLGVVDFLDKGLVSRVKVIEAVDSVI